MSLATGYNDGMDKQLSKIIDRLEASRARSKTVGKQHKRLVADFNAAVEKLNQAASELVESKAIAEEMRLRDGSRLSNRQTTAKGGKGHYAG